LVDPGPGGDKQEIEHEDFPLGVGRRRPGAKKQRLSGLNGPGQLRLVVVDVLNGGRDVAAQLVLRPWGLISTTIVGRNAELAT
jgi:hypothetical protein